MNDTDVIERQERRLRHIWLHGLCAAFVGGLSASAVSTGGAMMLANDRFNFSDHLANTLKLALGTWCFSGLMSAFAYLKQSPLPPLPKEIYDEQNESGPVNPTGGPL